MSVQFKTPNITGATDREKLMQIQSYLYQMAKQLQWAFDTIETGVESTGTGIVNTAKSVKETVDPITTFAALKNLIIKSADIVDSYYDHISKRLEGQYVAQSDFGTYVESTSHAILANSTAIEQAYQDLQQIITDTEKLTYTLIEVNAHIKSGLLYYEDDGTPVYGLDIGQRTEMDGVEVFNKYARFTSDKLSFYDSNGTEVAYISDRKLYITHIEVTGSYTQGGFVDKTLSDGSIVTKWIGGGS